MTETEPPPLWAKLVSALIGAFVCGGLVALAAPLYGGSRWEGLVAAGLFAIWQLFPVMGTAMVGGIIGACVAILMLILVLRGGL